MPGPGRQAARTWPASKLSDNITQASRVTCASQAPSQFSRAPLVPVVEDANRQGEDAADHDDPDAGPEQPPGRADGQRYPADDEADDDDGDRGLRGGTAVEFLVDIRRTDLRVKPVRARVSRTRHGA